MGKSVRFFPGSYISCTDGGEIEIGDNVAICRNVQIICRGGKINIGNNVHVGDGTIIVSRKGIHIGDDSLIGEYVVIRDQNHAYNTRPIRLAGFDEGSISIGNDVWIGAKATILKEASIGSGSIIGAHALVNNSLPEYSLAVGQPAKVVKSL